MNGTDLKIARFRSGAGQADIAEIMGVSIATISRLENRVTLKPDQVEKFMDALATWSKKTTGASA
jgi:transcriptional regulator with XRE-family HTH domain